ncbi:MAG: NifU family protein [Candidatus Komeilibacteria bacterium]
MKKIQEKIDQELDKIRPFLQVHGGNIKIEDFDQKLGILTLRLIGACHGCPLSAMTFENLVKSRLATIKGLNDIKLTENE